MLKFLALLFLKMMRQLFWLGLWAFGLSLWLWYPMRWWPGDHFLPVQLLNYAMPWLLVGLIPALLLAGLARRKRLATTLMMPTLLIIFTFAPLFLPRPDLVLANGFSLKVMSYNLWWRNHNAEAIMGIIQQEQPDIVLLQEVNPYFVLDLKKRQANLYPSGQTHISYAPGMDQVIISRFPITALTGSHAEGRAQKAIIETPDGPITVWNVHPIQPRIWSSHYKQITNLSQAISAVETPLIVGGDFNTTYQSETYHLINQYLANAHWQAGWGFGFSFPSDQVKIKDIPVPTPVIHIDHIFYSDHFLAYKAYTVANSGGSDHFPVVAELSLIR